MSVKKKTYKADEIPIYDGEAILYLVKDTWYFRCWLRGEKKYARKSLRTKSRDMAIERAKKEFHQLQSDLDKGKKFFSIDIKEGVQNYLDFKKAQVVGDSVLERQKGGIVKGRFDTIDLHLRHFLTYVGKDTRVRDLDEFAMDGYVAFRRKKGNYGKGASDRTIRNEFSTINACMQYLYDRLKQTDFRKFLLPETLKHITSNAVDNERIKRQTFTREEWMAFVKAMRTYTKDCEKHADADEDAKARLLTRYFCLFGANSGMRYGEQMNLLWENVQVETQNVNKRETQIAKVLVAIGTSKKRHKSRDFWCRGGEYIERWKAIAKHNDKTGYVFSMNGQNKFPKTSFHRHWNRIMELAEIDEQKKQHIVPYSLRHFCVSQRIMAGLSFADVAKNLGTSVFHVESTYNHLQDEVRKRFAHADYKVVDGVAMPLMNEVL